MLKKIGLLFVLALTGASCVTSGTGEVIRGEGLLASTQRIISGPDKLSYEPLKFGESAEFAFDDQAPVLPEGGNRRFAKGFSLPVTTGAYSVSVTSYKTGTATDPAIMYPQVQVLNKDHKVVREVQSSAFVLRPSISGEALNAVFFVNNVAQGERFLLITNRSIEDADLVVSQANVTSVTPLIVPLGGGLVGMWSIPTGKNSPPVKMKASPTGQMAVLCQEYHPKKVGE